MTTIVAAPVRGSAFRPLRTTGGGLPAQPRAGRGAGALLTDAFSMIAVVLAIPFIILGLGLPLALAVRLLLWIASRIL